ncbi:MAG TPA: acetyl-CoA carboxylase carboxyltransferase subunit alpha [Planctomycetota bacterium]|nr:acetyl-CoA carboxylase carboxyltransferase subunit alpha [Planctomycetota bacterium]
MSNPTANAGQSAQHVLEFERPIAELENKIEELVAFAATAEVDLTAQIEELRGRAADLVREIYAGLTPWQRVQIARHPNRPGFVDFQQAFVEDFVELQGDRLFRDDRAISTGFGRIGGRRVMIVAQRKGKTTKERIACNFGMPHPEGYRKALRKMKLAEKLGLPIVTFINTQGAYPGVGSEERGVAFAIAENLMEMSRLKVPVICVVLAEGGSGGALAIGVGDRVLMMEHAYYSVITPEGCAAILWKTAERAPHAAGILRITARDLHEFGIVDEIVREPAGGAHRNQVEAARLLKASIVAALESLEGVPVDRLLADRYEKLRRIGAWIEGQPIEADLAEDLADAEESLAPVAEAFPEKVTAAS